jgi:hypothetical protein
MTLRCILSVLQGMEQAYWQIGAECIISNATDEFALSGLRKRADRDESESAVYSTMS